MLEIQVRDLFACEDYKGKTRDEMWAKALASGWVFSNVNGTFRMKVIKL